MSTVNPSQKPSTNTKLYYPFPGQGTVWGIDLSNYEVTGGEENEGGERSETWDSWLHQCKEGRGAALRAMLWTKKSL